MGSAGPDRVAAFADETTGWGTGATDVAGGAGGGSSPTLGDSTGLAVEAGGSGGIDAAAGPGPSGAVRRATRAPTTSAVPTAARVTHAIAIVATTRAPPARDGVEPVGPHEPAVLGVIASGAAGVGAA